jgi:hypothetical protein
MEEIQKYFGLVHNNNGYNHVFKENLEIITKVEDLWIDIHQKLRVLVLRIISLGMARRVVMDLKEQQRQKDSLVKLMNNEKDNTKVVDEGVNLVPNGSCLNVIMLEEIMHYLKFA